MWEHVGSGGLSGVGTSRYRCSVQDTHTPLQRFRMSKELWDRFGEVVGVSNRSDDLRTYVEWRIDNPDASLPRRRRRRTDVADLAEGSAVESADGAAVVEDE